MGSLLQLIVLSTVGAFLLWLGYTLFVGFSPRRPASYAKRSPDPPSGVAGAPRTCPVCAARLAKGERVKSSAFPSVDGGDRLMHIFGCPYCTTPNFPRDRSCPVCGKSLPFNAYLIARLFDKPGRSHVHVLGCTQCRGPRARS
jgi:hypothetical protein